MRLILQPFLGVGHEGSAATLKAEGNKAILEVARHHQSISQPVFYGQVSANMIYLALHIATGLHPYTTSTCPVKLSLPHETALQIEPRS